MAKHRAETVDDQLRDIINSRGLSAYAVAQGAGVHKSIISRFMADDPKKRRGLTSQSMNKVCKWLNVYLAEGARPAETVPTPKQAMRRVRLKRTIAEKAAAKAKPVAKPTEGNEPSE